MKETGREEGRRMVRDLCPPPICTSYLIDGSEILELLTVVQHFRSLELSIFRAFQHIENSKRDNRKFDQRRRKRRKMDLRHNFIVACDYSESSCVFVTAVLQS